MDAYQFWFVIFIFVAYLIVTNDSAAYAATLFFNIVRFQYKKQMWWLLHNPQNLVVKWLMYRNALRMAKEIQKQLKK